MKEFVTWGLPYLFIRYAEACLQAATASTLGFCPLHFTQLFNEGRIRIPLSHGKEPRMPELVGSADSFPANNVTSDYERRTVRDHIKSVKQARTSRRSNLAHQRTELESKPTAAHHDTNSDLSESSGVDEEAQAESRLVGRQLQAQDLSKLTIKGSRKSSKSTKRPLCISGQSLCRNYGSSLYNGFCQDCYELLCRERLSQLSVPEPVACSCSCQNCVDRARTFNHHRSSRSASRRSTNHDRTTYRCRCRSCNCSIQGGCFCCHCSQLSKLDTMGSKAPHYDINSYGLNASPTGAHRTTRHKSPVDVCSSDIEPDCGNVSEFSSLPPTDSGLDTGQYVMSIADYDYVVYT